MKTCAGCRQEKPKTEFYKNKRRKDGLNRVCKPCHSAGMKAWKAANYEHRHQKYVANKGPVRNRGLRLRYGITLEEYNRILDKQQGCCAVCGRGAPDGRSLDVDHDHLTGCIRGLLCPNCNLALGHLDDDPDRVFALLGYLKAFYNTFMEVTPQ